MVPNGTIGGYTDTPGHPARPVTARRPAQDRDRAAGPPPDVGVEDATLGDHTDVDVDSP
jgi:hypothetical protein